MAQHRFLEHIYEEAGGTGMQAVVCCMTQTVLVIPAKAPPRGQQIQPGYSSQVLKAAVSEEPLHVGLGAEVI